MVGRDTPESSEGLMRVSGCRDAHRPSRRVRRRRARRLRLGRGRLAPDACARGYARRTPRRHSTASGSDTYPTSTSARRSRAGTVRAKQAARWVGERRPDLVCITGDLVSHPRGVPRLEALLADLERPFVVLGNHDVAVTRDPFSRAAEVRDLEHARLLGDETVVLVLRGERVAVVGVDPLTYRAKQARPHELADQGAALRLLLCHFPRIVERIPRSSFDLILTGHLHAGQICLPLPGRRVTLAHPRAQFVSGLYGTRARADARFAGHRDDVRPASVLRPTRGDGARPSASELDWRR